MGHDQRESTTVLVIGGMHCAACVGRVEKALRSRAGVETAGVNLLTRLATVRHDASVRPSELVASIAEVGYQATLASPTAHARDRVSFGDTIDIIASRKSRFIAGAIFTLLILLVQYTAADSASKLGMLFLLATPVQITVGWEYYRGFIRALKKFRLNMDSLVVMGSSAAYVQGFLCFMGQVGSDPDVRDWHPQFHVAALILTFVSLGKWMESWARESTAHLWGNLIEMAPKEACVLRDGREQIIPAGVVAVGDIVLVRPHEKIPVDGEIIEGSSEINEGPITGEGRPIPKVRGDRVMVASINGSGFIRVRAMGVGADSTIAQIARMVHEARVQKGRVEQLADRVSAVLVPVALCVSAGTFAFWYFGPWAVAGTRVAAALKPAIAVLIAACPCALGLATPAAAIVAGRLFARRGVLIEGSEAIEAAARVSDVVFDKTGTLTDGSFRAHEVITQAGVEREEFLNLCGSLEACSEHALAKGIVREAKKKTLQLRHVDDFEALPGRGLKGTVGRKSYILGSRVLLEERKIKLGGDFEKQVAAAEAAGATLIFLAEEEDGKLLGAIALTDRVKESAAPAISELRALGIGAYLLSGDNAASASAVGQSCGLKPDEVHGLMSPEDKANFIRQLKSKGRFVGAVGDGINDAPALAASDVGFALGTGTGIAIESGEILLVSSDVGGVVRAIRLAGEAAAIIRWNIFWAFSFSAIMMPVAVMGNHLLLREQAASLAAGIMAGTSMIVVLNALRLMGTRVEAPCLVPAVQ